MLRGSAECAAALETAAGLPARLWGSAAVMQGELQAYLPISPCISPYLPISPYIPPYLGQVRDVVVHRLVAVGPKNQPTIEQLIVDRNTSEDVTRQAVIA